MKFVLVCLFAIVSACSHGESKPDKKVDASKSAPVAPMPHASSPDEMVARYSVLELNSAANLLKVVIDQAGAQPAKDVGSDLIGCPLTGKQAGTMTMPLKALIDGVVRSETENYVTDPKNYATEKGFEMCGSQCACGVLSDIVEAANESSMPPGTSGKLHARNKQRLSLKASHQTSIDSVACAKKQSWFCSSDLKSYLDKEAHENAD